MSTTTKARRVRCAGEHCGSQLVDPSELRPIGPKRKLCETCIVAEAEKLADATHVETTPPDHRETLPDEPHPDWPGRKGRLSPSELGTFLACPEQWRQERILGRWGLSNGSSIAGNAVHATAEAYWQNKIAGGDPLDEMTIKATAAHAYDAQVEHELKMSKGVIDWRDPMTRGAAREASMLAASAYLTTVGPRIHPVSLEATTILRVAGVPIPIVSRADLTRADEAGGPPVAIVDLKSGGKTHKQHDTYWTVQGLVQQLGQPLACEWHSVDWQGNVLTPEEEPGLRIVRDAARLVIATELIRTTYQTILLYHERFGPYNVWPGARSQPQTCGMCDHVSDCSWWTGEDFLRAGDFGVDL
jgi:hypothetical protein